MTGGLPETAPTKHLERVMGPAAREYYRRLAEEDELATTRCPRCERVSFPPLERCARCGAATEWVALPRHGRLEAFTTQETSLRFAAPAVLALARMGEATVPGIVDEAYDELRIGDEVEARAVAEPALGLSLVRYRRVGASGG